MEQVTFADVEYEGKKRRTRRELFLERMEALVPWERLEERIRPFYPKAGRGRQPYPLAAMLRIHCVQLCYNLSDPGMEDMLYEIESVRRFAGLRLAGPLPDETTILNFRHLLERHGLGRGLFEEINAYLAERGYRVRAGTIVDASIIAAPSSTKNREGVRDPEMHQTKKGNEWHFGMKAHIGWTRRQDWCMACGRRRRTRTIFGRRGRCFTGGRRRCGRTRATRGSRSGWTREAVRCSGMWR